MQSERVFQAVERSKHEHERFYRASAELNRALTLDEVYDAAIAGARGVCEFEFAAIATYDARRGSHTIRRVVGESAENLVGTSHKDPSSIASMVGQEQAGAAGGRRVARARRAGLLAPDARSRTTSRCWCCRCLVKDEVDRAPSPSPPRAPPPSPPTGARCWG